MINDVIIVIVSLNRIDGKFTFISSICLFDTTCSILLYTIWRANELLNGNFIDIHILRCMIRWYEFDNLMVLLAQIGSCVALFSCIFPSPNDPVQMERGSPRDFWAGAMFHPQIFKRPKNGRSSGVHDFKHSLDPWIIFYRMTNNWCWKSTNQQIGHQLDLNAGRLTMNQKITQ